MNLESGITQTPQEQERARLEAELNKNIDNALLENPNKMPKAVYFILPNETAERFCFYGLNPLLNPFFSKYLGLGKETATELTHGFKTVAYFTPLLGAALSDSFLGKYETIVSLSFVYVCGTALMAVFAIPFLKSVAGSMAGIFLVAVGTGGIKPCVSSHGGDQFLDVQKEGLNRFYNYFYMAINIGAIASNYAAPAINNLECFGLERGNCYAWAYAMCGITMFVSWIIFIAGKSTYRIVPSAKVFLPWIVLKVLVLAAYRSITASGPKKEGGMLEYVVDDYPEDIMEEVRDVSTMFWVLIPAVVFWLGFDQNNSTWENQYTQLSPYWGAIYIDEATSTIWNPILIVLLVPLFSNYIYPAIEKQFGRFRLLDRMLVGMGFAALAFVASAILQTAIDNNLEALEYNEKSDVYECPHDEERAKLCYHGSLQFIPYLIITIGEVLFSISGLNFTYEEVGKRMKASAASLWLLMVAIGNLLVVFLAKQQPNLGCHDYVWFHQEGVCL